MCIHVHIHYSIHKHWGWCIAHSQHTHTISIRVTLDHRRQPTTLHKDTRRDLEGDFAAAATAQGEADKGVQEERPPATPLPESKGDVKEPPHELPVPPPELSWSAVDKRLRRLMNPTARGEFKIPEEVRNQWLDKSTRESVMSLFEKCAYSPDWFEKKTCIIFEK